MVNKLTLRQILNQLSATVNDDFTEDQLLDLPIKIRIPHSSATFQVRTCVQACSVEEKKEYSKAEQRVTVVDKWIQLDTNPVT